MNTKAYHAQNEGKHLVCVDALRVMIIKDGKSWFAQGLEIDYASAGSSVEEAKKNFGLGLKMTIGEHLQMYGHIENLLQVAPQEAWNEYINSGALKMDYSTVQLHDLGIEPLSRLSEIVFLQPVAQAA